MVEVAVPKITLDVASGGYPLVESLTVEMLGLQNRGCHRDAEVLELEGRLRQVNVEVKDLQRHIQEMAVQLHEEISASRALHQRLHVSATEHRDRAHEVFETAAKHSRDEVVKLAVVDIDHVFQDSCMRDKKDDGAGLSSHDN